VSAPGPRNLDDVTMVAVDGMDALAIVIVRPGNLPGMVKVQAEARGGMSKRDAAYILRDVADRFEAEAAAEEQA
jgi:hypothetical protein